MNCGMHHIRHRMCLDKARQSEQGKHSVNHEKVTYVAIDDQNEIFHLSFFVFFKMAVDIFKSTL